MISGAEQPIKLREKHYPPPQWQYMLKSDVTLGTCVLNPLKHSICVKLKVKLKFY
jgi:hypothetical protein